MITTVSLCVLEVDAWEQVVTLHKNDVYSRSREILHKGEPTALESFATQWVAIFQCNDRGRI